MIAMTIDLNIHFWNVFASLLLSFVFEIEILCLKPIILLLVTHLGNHAVISCE
jgi:hypothetical protein